VALVASIGLALIIAAPAAAGGGGRYAVHRLVSHGIAGQADDPNLINGWGLSAGPSTPWWVADNGTNKSTLYDGDGNIVPLVVQVNGGPTGTVFNGSSDFMVHHNGNEAASLFLFASEDGKLRGWNSSVDASKAHVIADRSGVDADYKGLAIASIGDANYLYAADFHNGRVDVFDGDNHLQHWAGAFRDPGIPDGYAPFGIQTLGHRIYVTYAKQDAHREDEVAGAHLGFVDVFKKNGVLVARIGSHGPLNAPWGLARAPDNFGRFSGDLLVGNFGNGRIHAYKHTSSGWMLDGVLRNGDDNPIHINGLWAIAFGNGGAAGPTNSLYFAAGPKDETAGLFGSITVHS
jgi:uncharacterized protein (TIGR03118 family)